MTSDANGGPLGPECVRLSYTPQEVAAIIEHRERAAAAAAWLAAREACEEAVYALRIAVQSDGTDKHFNMAIHNSCTAIAALPPPADAMAALAEMLERARREAFEEAAIEADRVAARAHTALQEPGLIDAIRRDFLHQRNGARDAAAAIRARAAGGAA